MPSWARRVVRCHIVLLALGSPIWLSLLVCGAAVVISLYAVLWSIVVGLWGVFVSFAASAVFLIGASVPLLFGGNGTSALASLGMGIACAGFSILLFLLSVAGTRLAARLSAKLFRGVLSVFRRKERVS